jgi:glycosyltransferase involved in cell wall biosynthesis
VIPNPVPFPAGIDRARGPALKRWGAAAEARLGSLPTGEVWALALGRVHPGKGQERVLELWPSLAANVRRRLRVLFVGPSADADYRASLESRARALPDGERLMWFPGVANPSACFAAADVYLSLSDFEGMPLAPVEAFAMGCPMVLSDIPGHRELALPGARYVSLSGADPALALGEALLGATPASAEDYARARDRFDPARVALDYARLYREADAR